MDKVLYVGGRDANSEDIACEDAGVDMALHGCIKAGSLPRTIYAGRGIRAVASLFARYVNHRGVDYTDMTCLLFDAVSRNGVQTPLSA